jgi:2-polyprenyl-3-methyl-5-hydroxy-6-metoxy-1,4-benzoquinol methylase
MSIYPYLYRPFQNLIALIFLKKNFKNLLCNYLNSNEYEEIHDIGCSDGQLALNLDLNKTKYNGYDIDLINIKKAKKKFRNYKNTSFYYKSIENIKITNKKKKIFILKGVFHHLHDQQIINFINKLSKNDHVIALDGFYHQNQNIISVVLKRLDQGNFIRDYNGYKKLLKNFTFSKKINYYLRFYSHLISFKNINKQKIKKYF